MQYVHGGKTFSALLGERSDTFADRTNTTLLRYEYPSREPANVLSSHFEFSLGALSDTIPWQRGDFGVVHISAARGSTVETR